MQGGLVALTAMAVQQPTAITRATVWAMRGMCSVYAPATVGRHQ